MLYVNITLAKPRVEGSFYIKLNLNFKLRRHLKNMISFLSKTLNIVIVKKTNEDEIK